VALVAPVEVRALSVSRMLSPVTLSVSRMSSPVSLSVPHMSSPVTLSLSRMSSPVSLFLAPEEKTSEEEEDTDPKVLCGC
jgi:hypothetical protein